MSEAFEERREKHRSISCRYFTTYPPGPGRLDRLNEAMRETVLIHFSGQDHTGLTAALTGILSQYDACILDIGQAVVHETLALGLLIEVPPGRDFAPLKAALLARSRQIGLQVRFTPISEDALEHWIRSQGKDRFIITVLGRTVSA